MMRLGVPAGAVWCLFVAGCGPEETREVLSQRPEGTEGGASAVQESGNTMVGKVGALYGAVVVYIPAGEFMRGSEPHLLHERP